MKILMTSETYSPRVGGAEVHVMNLLNNLKHLGNDVVLITNEMGGDPKEKGVLRIKWKKTSIFKIFKIIWEKSTDVDVIHSHYSYRLALISSIIGRIRGVPVIITLHGMGILNHPNTPPLYQAAHAMYRYFSLKFSTHIISTSRDLAEYVYKYVKKEKVTIIFNGYDQARFNTEVVIDKEIVKQYDDKKVIVTVRRLVPKNGIHYLVEAMPYIVKSIPNSILVIAGEGTMRGYLEKRIRSLSLVENVKVLGEVPNDQVAQYIEVADVVVFPSTAESSSIACAEAMGMGKMIVSSRVGGLIELLGEDEERGYLVDLVSWTNSNYNAPLRLDGKQYQVLADHVIKALSDSSFNLRKKQNALKYASRNLTWDAVTQKTMSVYNKFKK